MCVCVGGGGVASCVYLCGCVFAGDKGRICCPVESESLSWNKVLDEFS